MNQREHGYSNDQVEELKRLLRRNREQYQRSVQQLKDTRRTVRRNYHGMVQLLIEVISLNNRYLGSHLKRCAEMSWHFSRFDQKPKDICYLHYYGALLHDIGMVGKSPLLSSTPSEELSDQDLQLYRQHPQDGERIISAIYNLKRTATIIRAHHERYDGRGFPDQIQGSAIPYGAQLIRLVNDWDNLLYKYGYSQEESINRIDSGKGSLYNPDMADRFLRFIPTWSKEYSSEGTLVSLSSLKVGMFLKDDIVLNNGLLLVPHGIVLDEETIAKIDSFSSMLPEDQEVRVID